MQPCPDEELDCQLTPDEQDLAFRMARLEHDYLAEIIPSINTNRSRLSFDEIDKKISGLFIYHAKRALIVRRQALLDQAADSAQSSLERPK